MRARINANQILAVVVALFALVYLYGAFEIRRFPIPRPIDSDLVPKVLGVLMLGLAVLLFFQRPGTGGAVLAAEEEEAEAAPGPDPERRGPGPVLQVALTALAIAAYAALLRPLGFVVASALLTFGLAALFGYRGWLVAAAVAVAVTLGLYLALTRGMGIFLPPGILPL